MKLLLAALLCSLAPVASAVDRPEQFAYAVVLESDGALPLRRVDLPPPVYQGVLRADLGDVRVFNADGEVVPHALLPLPAAEARPSESQSLPHFPVLARPGERLDGLDIKVERTATGTIARVATRGSSRVGDRVVSAYVIDASHFKQPMQALDLDWRDTGDGLAGSMRVEASEDLTRWSTLVSEAPVVSLQFAGQRLEQKTIELPPGRRKYLRLSWPSSQSPLALTGVKARIGSAVIEPARSWKLLEGSAANGREGEFEFDLGGQFPVDRVRVEMPNDNTLVSAQLLSRRAAQDQWRLVTGAVFYQLRVGDRAVRSPDLAVNLDHDRFWLLRVDQIRGAAAWAAAS